MRLKRLVITGRATALASVRNHLGLCSFDGRRRPASWRPAVHQPTSPRRERVPRSRWRTLPAECDGRSQAERLDHRFGIPRPKRDLRIMIEMQSPIGVRGIHHEPLGGDHVRVRDDTRQLEAGRLLAGCHGRGQFAAMAQSVSPCARTADNNVVVTSYTRSAARAIGSGAWRHANCTRGECTLLGAMTATDQET